MARTLAEVGTGQTLAGIAPTELDDTVTKATRALLAQQKADGHFVFELEADATMPAEYVLLTHWCGEKPILELEHKIANYLRRIQGAHGGWPLFHEVLITIEEGAVGGFGSFVLQYLAGEGLFDRGVKVRPMVLPDAFIDQDKPERMYEAAGLNAPDIVAVALTALGMDTLACKRVDRA